MNILLKEVFAGIFASIACWNHHYDFLECSDKSSKFNSFAFTLSAVLYLRVMMVQTFRSLIWMKGTYFASFYFRVLDLTREIRENKNPAKISTYTVFAQGGHLNTSVVHMCNQRNAKKKKKRKEKKRKEKRKKVVFETEHDLRNSRLEVKTCLFSRKRVLFEFFWGI